MVYTQENRAIVIDTPLGDNVLLLQRFSGTDGLSVPFSFELDLVSENSNIAFQDIIGQNVTVSVVLADGERRFFNGIISRFSQYSGIEDTDHGHQLAHYSATMVPWFWLLSRTSDSRIFQKLSIPDIVEQIFTEKGFNDFRMNLHDTYDPKEYCVQYRETDFNFVSRLLEQEGIFYFFEHEQRKHTMILADSTEEHRPCPGQGSVRYHPLSTGERTEEDVITSLDKTQEITVGKYTVNDFNFTMPTTDLKVEVSSQHSLGPGESDRYEVYDYPAEYNVRSEGDRLANIRMQAEEARITTITGTSTCRAFTSGYRFNLTECYRNEMNDTPYVLTSVNHDASEPVGSSGGGAGASYSNNFCCIPFDVLYRPPLVTPKPMIAGSQTAIVTGPAGEEIHCDEHGRVKAQFHWDREGNKDDKASCWIRVSQVWAGARWGAMHIPRIGQEVIVDFLEGDPDRPIIIGRVYHAHNMPPYGLPGQKMVSGMKSNTTPGGGGYNEFILDDTSGNELIRLHGQYDMDSTIEHDLREHVLNDRSRDVTNNENATIGVNQTLQVGGNQSVSVGQNQSVTVGGNRTITVSMAEAESVALAKALSIGGGYQVSVGAAMNETVGGAKMEEIGAYRMETVAGRKQTNVGGNNNLSVGGDNAHSVVGNSTLSVSGDLQEQISGQATRNVTGDSLLAADGNAKFHAKGDSALNADGNVAINAKGDIEQAADGDIKCNATQIKLSASSKIELKCGGSTITIAPGEISIKGPMVKINC